MRPNARLLLVDDDPVLLRSATHALVAAGYEVEEAFSGAECLRVVQARPPDLILMDVVLPDASGLELCRRLKSDGATAEIFVVLISGFQTSSGHQVAGLEAGADAYFTRPIESRELVARIQALLRLQRAQAELRRAHEGLERRVAERTAELLSANQSLRAEIAERRELEARFLQSQKLEAVGQLAAGLAHDFNNILTIISCNTSLLLKDPRLPRDLEIFLRDVSMAAERGADLTHRLLLFTRQQVIRPRVLDLNQCVERLSQILRSAIGETISLNLQLAPGEAKISADQVMIEQTILNLAVNARDAMPQGGRLAIQTELVDVDATAAARFPGAIAGSYVRLSVIDNGCGMSAATRERIFEAFFTTKEVGKGTGLGLSTVHGIVSQHRGWIDVESEIGVGSAFHLYFPAATGRALSPPDGVSLPAPAPASRGAGRETILLVEDEPVVRTLGRTILEREGYRVLTAVSGVAALEVWREHQSEIDLVLSDIVMPDGLNGWELASRLRVDKPGLKFVLTSGYGTDAVGRDFVLPEAYHFLEKPFDSASLARAIRDCLDG